MVQACLDGIPEFAHRRRMNLADGPSLSLIEMACQFQGSAIRVQQFLPTREYQNTGSVAHRVIQRTQFGDRSLSEWRLRYMVLLLDGFTLPFEWLLTIRKRAGHTALLDPSVMIDCVRGIRCSSNRSSDRSIPLRVHLLWHNIFTPYHPARERARAHRPPEAIRAHDGILDTSAIDATCGRAEAAHFVYEITECLLYK
jgi:hypothetical protein